MSTEKSPPPPSTDKKAWALAVVQDLLELMAFPATLDVKDAADGAVSVALHPVGEYPGVTPGKRSQVIDALQLMVNKAVNRPGTERRWINLGLGAHPEPRGQQQPQQKAPRVAKVAAAAVASPGGVAGPPGGAAAAVAGAAPGGAPGPGQVQAQRPERPARPGREPREGREGRAEGGGRSSGEDESKLEVPEDPEFAQVVRLLAEKSAKFGRFFALTPLSQEARARALKAGQGVEGVRVHPEGEGRNRRVVFTPAKPLPMPKRALPDYDDEEDDEEDEG